MSLPTYSNRDGRGVKWQWPSIHPEGRKFGLIAAAVTLLLWFVVDWDVLGWLMAGLTAWVLAFFRDPVRVTPQQDDLVVAPADGLITLIEKVPPPPEMAGNDGLGDAPMTRVSIFMSVFDVHINRAPVSGTVKTIAYIPGLFVNADLDKASEDNERQHMVFERGDGTRIGMTQIAGLVARRIVASVRPGDSVTAGQRVGLIRFGSRVDVYLPEGTEPLVLLGQRSVAGETLIARIGDAPQLIGTGQ